MAEVPQWADLIGRPFSYGGRGPECFDCYGLVVEMLARQGVTAPIEVSPRNDQDIAALIDGSSASKWARCERKPGAVVTFRIGRLVSHVGYLIDQNRMIHAWQSAGGVCVERLSFWEKRIHAYYEIKTQ